MSIRSLIDKALEQSTAADPRDLAANVLMRIDVDSREEALLEALGVCVEARIYESRGEVPGLTAWGPPGA